VRIDDFEFDDANEAHMARHGVTPEECRQVLEDEETIVTRNKRTHPDQTHVVVGRTHGGRWLAIPIKPTGRSGIWRPATARAAERHERPD